MDGQMQKRTKIKLLRDHPRVCGEKSVSIVRAARRIGSPPRVRGKGSSRFFLAGSMGITPACAGKRPTKSSHDLTGGDHPRVCGEKPSLQPARPPQKGSPPRVRGKEIKPEIILVWIRITPACAGKSWLAIFHACPNQDHPRVCGEKITAVSYKSIALGSPPRVRGKALLWLG